MKFINSVGPNPRCVRMFMAEKGISIPFAEINLLAGENRKPPYTDKNPGGQMPALELDNSTTLAETVAICEYLERRTRHRLWSAQRLKNGPKPACGRDESNSISLNICITAFVTPKGSRYFKIACTVCPRPHQGSKRSCRKSLHGSISLWKGNSSLSATASP